MDYSMNPVAQKIVLMMLLLYAATAVGQDAVFNVIGLEGTARVQRSNDRSWKKLEPGSKLADNDLVETYFQTKLVMQFGVNNVIILGSNSKALLNITAANKAGKNITEISVTLFSGGLFTKAISQCKVNIYTANAVGVMDSGSVTTVAESKTGETGFQALGGMVFVRNIAQQKGIELRSGLTTMIQPAKEPTAPLYITHRHVAVLKHFFGDDYITSELDASGIQPTDERGSRGRGGSSAFATRARGYIDEGMNRSLFNLSRIYGSILTDREMTARFYQSIRVPVSPVEGRGLVALTSDIGFSALGASARVVPSVSYTWGKLDAGVRLSFVQTAEGVFSPGFGSLGGILDKIHHVAIGNSDDRWSVFAGEIDNMTLGYGLVVDDFSNISYTNAFSPLGVTGRFRVNDELSLQAFTADCGKPMVNGFYALYEPSVYHFGTGYIGDLNQYIDMVVSSERRFVNFPALDTLFPDVARKISAVHCYLFDFSADIASWYDFEMKLTIEFVKKLNGANDGFVARMPGFQCDIEKIRFGGGFILESGRMLSGQFDPLYFDRRYTIKSAVNEFIDSVLTPNNRLGKKREAFGLSLFYKMNPYRGVDVDASYKQDFTGKSTFDRYGLDTLITEDVPFDYSFRLRIGINDSLFKYIQVAQLLLQQSHGRLFPESGMPFSSWTFNARITAVSIPLLFNLAFETGADFFYFDSGDRRNNEVDPEDFIFTARAGVRWGFK